MYPIDRPQYVKATWEVDAVAPLRIPVKDPLSKLGTRSHGRRNRSDGARTFEHDAKTSYLHDIDYRRLAPVIDAQEHSLSRPSSSSFLSSASSRRPSHAFGPIYADHSAAASKTIRPLPMAPLPPSRPSTPPYLSSDISTARSCRPLPPPPIPPKDPATLPQIPVINANGLPSGCAAPLLVPSLDSRNDDIEALLSRQASTSSDTSLSSNNNISGVDQFMHRPISEVEARFQRPIFVKTVVTGIFPKEEGSDDQSDAGEEKEGVKQYQIHWIPPPLGTMQRVVGKRYSKKWLREKAGRRREVEDYATVLRALRTLR